MKIIARTRTLRDDYRQSFEIEVDGKIALSFTDGEPEDNCLGRNFNDCYSIPDLLKKVWEAGKRQEEFVVEEVESEDE
jgi:hypothetical protein